MGRPRKAIRSVEKNICIPEDIVAAVELELWSELEGKVPFAAWQKLVVELLMAWLRKRQNGEG